MTLFGLEQVTARNLKRTPEQIALATDGLILDWGDFKSGAIRSILVPVS